MAYNLITFLIVPGDEIADMIKEIAQDAESDIQNDADGLDNLENHIRDAIERGISSYLHKQG